MHGIQNGKAKIPDELANLDFELDPIQTKAEFRQGFIREVTIDGQEAKKISFEKCLFQNTTFTESSLIGLELTDVRFDTCDLSNVCLTDSFCIGCCFSEFVRQSNVTGICDVKAVSIYRQ